MSADEKVVPFGRTNWRAETQQLHRKLFEHAESCVLCAPAKVEGKPPDVMIGTSCPAGVLLFSEWLTAANHRMAERATESGDAMTLFAAVLDESRVWP